MTALQPYQADVKKEMLIGGLSNTLFNGVIAWLLLRNGDDLILAGESGYAVDLLATAFILPFIVTLIVVPLNRRKVTSGAQPALILDQNHWLDSIMARFPANLAARAACIGLLSMLIFAPLTLLPLWALGIEPFSPLAYSIFKGIWAGCLAALLTAPMLLLAWQKT
jgi:hypothetical protein